MMLHVLLLAALAASASAFKGGCCSAEDRRELQFLWKNLWQTGFTDRKVAISGAVFEDLFSRYPEAKELFKRVKVDDPDSGEWRSHLIRVANGLGTIINLLDDTDVLAQHLAHLSDQHVARAGVKKVYFDGMAAAFEHVLPQVASCFNAEAWNRCFHRVAHFISEKLP